MANKEVSELTAATNIAGGESLHILQSGNSREATHEQFSPRVVGVHNGNITESRASNAVTFHLKTLGGADPSATDPVTLVFSDGTVRVVTSAVSVTLSSGSTIGATSGEAFRVWIVLVDDAGTIRLGLRNCSNTEGTVGFPATGVLSSTAEGGAGAADALRTTYTSVAVSSKRYLIAAFADYESGLTTAGIWDAAPTRITAFVSGMARPGEVVGDAIEYYNSTVPSTSSSTFVSSGFTASIDVQSPCNLVRVTAGGGLFQDTAGQWGYIRISRGTTANTNMVGSEAPHLTNSGTGVSPADVIALDKPGAAGSTTYAVQFRTGGSGTVFWPYGIGSLYLEEIMG